MTGLQDPSLCDRPRHHDPSELLPDQWDGGSAAPKPTEPLGTMLGWFAQGLGELWEAMASSRYLSSGQHMGQDYELASLTAAALLPEQGWLPPRVKIKYKSTQNVQWGIWAQMWAQNWVNMTVWITVLLDPISRWSESLWPVSLDINWLNCTLSKIVQFLASPGLSQLLLNPLPSARIIIISRWFLTKGRIEVLLQET